MPCLSIYEAIGARIRKLREQEGLSQEQLAKRVAEATNTISRWETATYKPSLEDLEKIARALGDISIVDLLPEGQVPADQGVGALLRSAKALDKKDLLALRRYADWLRAEHVLAKAKGPKKKRES